MHHAVMGDDIEVRLAKMEHELASGFCLAVLNP